LAGSGDARYTTVVPATGSPSWQQILVLGSTGSPATDLLKIVAYDGTGKQDLRRNPVIGAAELWIHDLPLGVTHSFALGLQKVHKRGSIVHGSSHGAAGTLNLVASIYRSGQTADRPWAVDFYRANVEFISGEDLPTSNVRGSFSYLDARVFADGSTNRQGWMSKLNPSRDIDQTWKQSVGFFVPDLSAKSFLEVRFFFRQGHADERQASLRLPFSGYKVGEAAEIESFDFEDARGRIIVQIGVTKGIAQGLPVPEKRAGAYEDSGIPTTFDREEDSIDEDSGIPSTSRVKPAPEAFKSKSPPMAREEDSGLPAIPSIIRRRKPLPPPGEEETDDEDSRIPAKPKQKAVVAGGTGLPHKGKESSDEEAKEVPAPSEDTGLPAPLAFLRRAEAEMEGSSDDNSDVFVPHFANAPARVPVAIAAPAHAKEEEEEEETQQPRTKAPILIAPKRDEPEEASESDFDWGDDGSSFSTDFSSCSGYDKSLSPGGDGDAGRPHSEPPPVDHPSPGHKISGKVIGGTGLAGNATHVTVQIVSVKQGTPKSDPKESAVIEGTSDPQWGFKFDMGEVKKTLAVEFTVWHGRREIGAAKKVIKDIEIDNSEPVRIELLKPGGDQPEPDGRWGAIEVKLKHRLNYP
jgi:hypothetical protein